MTIEKTEARKEYTPKNAILLPMNCPGTAQENQYLSVDDKPILYG